MQRKDLITLGWKDYELLDSGDGMKLERYGEIILSRPETQALWKPERSELWKKAHAVFEWSEGKSAWKVKKDIPTPLPNSWPLSWNDISFTARMSAFKHTGIFPEQSANWQWLRSVLKGAQGLTSATPDAPKVLNLFGYTGIASVVAAHAGAVVTHIDASKQSLDWAHDNARLSGIPEGTIKYLFEDAMQFVRREVRRGTRYDGIILDPPAFGRGAKGEVWKIEEQLPELIALTKEILSLKPGSFYLLNGYAAGYSAQSFSQLVESVFGDVSGNFGDLNIKESGSERVIPAGIYTSFVV